MVETFDVLAEGANSPAVSFGPFSTIEGQIADQAPVAANDSDGADAEGIEVNDPAEQPSRLKTPNTIVRDAAKEKLKALIGLRLMKSRELSGLRQLEASAMLGYVNSTQLNLWEQGRRMPPLTELIKIAEVYSVPLDYLVGTTDETERDPALALRRGCLNGVRKQLERVAEITVDSIAKHTGRVGAHAQHVREVLVTGKDFLEAYETFVRHNLSKFNIQRGSASLVRVAEDFENALLASQKAIREHDAEDAELRRSLAALSLTDDS
jgi:transcriptional regulator with XRE-family HTH domain